MTWPLRKLSELSEVITKGTTPTTLGYSYVEKGVRFLRAQNISDGKVNIYEDDLFIDYEVHKKLARSIIKNGDLLVSIAGSIGRAGVVDVTDEHLNCNQAVAIIRLKEEVCSSYIKHIIESEQVKRQIQSYTVTGVISNLSLTQLGNLTFPLPPLSEQRRIAELLDAADDVFSLRQQAIIKLDDLSQSVFSKLLDECAHESIVTLEDVTVNVNNIKPETEYFGESFTYIDIGSVSNKEKSICETNLIDANEAPSRARQKILIDDVLVSTVRPNLNAVAKVNIEYKNPIASTGFCVLRCNDSKIMPEIVFGIVKSKKFINEMIRLATGASYPAVTDKIVKSYKFPAVPMDKQREFAKFVKECQKNREIINQHYFKSKELICSLRQKSFAAY